MTDLPTNTAHWTLKDHLLIWPLAVVLGLLIPVLVIGAGLDQVKNGPSRSCRARTQKERSPNTQHFDGKEG